MSVLKCKHECKTLLDFTNTKRLSKNMIKNRLRKAELNSYRRDKSGAVHRITYDILVGIYLVRLGLNSDVLNEKRKLRDYGSFSITIMELTHIEILGCSGFYPVSDNSNLFKSQYWFDNNQIRIKDLVNAIIYCHKLNKLKSFL